MTQCIAKQLTFSFLKKRKLTVDFEGGEITSDAGLLLIRQADNVFGLTAGLIECISDKRDIRYIYHAM
ncbi:MAG: transposase, partial [Candidatus Parvarchaeum sp.]|nr:transposase [Candidatus Parvarchaeum tengchongense]